MSLILFHDPWGLCDMDFGGLDLEEERRERDRRYRIAKALQNPWRAIPHGPHQHLQGDHDLSCKHFHIASICGIHFWFDLCQYVFYRDADGLWKWARPKKVLARPTTCHRCDLAERTARMNGEDWVRGSPSAEKLMEHIDKELDDLCEDRNAEEQGEDGDEDGDEDEEGDEEYDEE
ncbi:uncharacterized protein STEHIDRAFT_162947 [Stereum hirsutum FP-91666 SS1]|uniref:Uncharacterized protein n=1 Tax=Stereum hirsutum (strain FP-91666) TaxID=721885 RepID=R7RYU0_STEHR|nr:uncharacterized protein STEHIDRAFT_162947 [Stereum hirsutum FP-91666 SS1]EIM80060.1 hypothetical protein STEHIDRAFT_162947 [Stereum hirsutum FP-91666 SS1]